jgi:hypothetical protein
MAVFCACKLYLFLKQTCQTTLKKVRRKKFNCGLSNHFKFLLYENKVFGFCIEKVQAQVGDPRPQPGGAPRGERPGHPPREEYLHRSHSGELTCSRYSIEELYVLMLKFLHFPI